MLTVKYFTFIRVLTVFILCLNLLNMGFVTNALSVEKASVVKSTSSRCVSKRFMSMDFDASGGLKKLPVETVTDSNKKQVASTNLQELGTLTSLFRSPPSLGAGIDERFLSAPLEEKLLGDSDLLTKVHISYKQHSLLADLSSDKFGMMTKLEKVKLASREEFWTSSVDYQWRPTAAHAGGLMGDWKLDME